MNRSDPSDAVLHPEDRERDESGPWRALFLTGAFAWTLLAVLDWRVLQSGTFLWATVRSAYTLLLAPLSAAALLQDTRALAAAGVEFGRAKWVYAAVALFFPPVCVAYLLHRRRRVRSLGGRDDGPPAGDDTG
ncbi:hypothetical protein SAMN04487947_1870 [Halogeometricum rufum]|uniref:DUF2834 domain-containing protein n=1 Tax=Halogeometricum rufum TaxID=553469 RepID=A0A1I6GZD8_9EURY|nr:hypothetical protein [Halogeometricum rufum]SFR47575.1 hypothetical protein SAMN04487947_1870 [Halogeometricum rufum]